MNRKSLLEFWIMDCVADSAGYLGFFKGQLRFQDLWYSSPNIRVDDPEVNDVLEALISLDKSGLIRVEGDVELPRSNPKLQIPLFLTPDGGSRWEHLAQANWKRKAEYLCDEDDHRWFGLTPGTLVNAVFQNSIMERRSHSAAIHDAKQCLENLKEEMVQLAYWKEPQQGYSSSVKRDLSSNPPMREDAQFDAFAKGIEFSTNWAANNRDWRHFCRFGFSKQHSEKILFDRDGNPTPAVEEWMAAQR